MLRKTQVTQCRVSSKQIIEPFNVVERVGPGFNERSIVRAVRSFHLERGEEALHRRVVPAVPAATRAAGDTVISQQPLELLASVLAAVVSGAARLAGPRRQIAISIASVTSCEVICELIDQPTARRENRSSTTAT